MQEASIYERLGPANLKLLVDSFYDFVFIEETLTPLFSNTPKDVIKSKQLMFLTQFLGGPDLYSNLYGHPKLRARHLNHRITENHAISWLKCMKSAIDGLYIDEEFKKELFSYFPKVAFHMVNSPD